MNRSSQSFKDTERFKEDFGDEAVLVLVHGELTRTVLTADLGRLLRLEGCLGGNAPDNKQGLGSLPPVCREIAELKPAKVVYGPATFINTAVGQIQDEFAKQQQQRRHAGASRRPRPRGGSRSAAATRAPSRSGSRAPPPTRYRRSSSTTRCGSRSSTGSADIPQINDPAFVSTLVFDRTARRRRRPEVALRVPVPVEERGADPDPAAAGPDGCRAGACDRPDPDRHGREGLQAARGRALHRHGRAGGGGGAGGRHPALDLHPARRRPAC